MALMEILEDADSSLLLSSRSTNSNNAVWYLRLQLGAFVANFEILFHWPRYDPRPGCSAYVAVHRQEATMRPKEVCVRVIFYLQLGDSVVTTNCSTRCWANRATQEPRRFEKGWAACGIVSTCVPHAGIGASQP